MFDDVVLGLGGAQRCHQPGPLDLAVTDISPSALIRRFAGRCDVLDMHGGDARSELLDPGEGIGAAADDPGDIGFPGNVGRAFEDVLDRPRAVLQLEEFEIMIVPAEFVAGSLVRLADFLQALAEGGPAGSVGWPFLGARCGA